MKLLPRLVIFLFWMIVFLQPAAASFTHQSYNAESQRIGIGGTDHLSRGRLGEDCLQNSPTGRDERERTSQTTSLVVDPNGAMSKVLVRNKNGTVTRYVYGAGLQYEVSSAGVATYYHYDQAGNTAALTNQAGTIVERVAYSPYGTIRYRQSNFDTPFLYGGFFGVMTDTNGLLQMRARYYNSLTMRFINADPAMDGWNWYAYANGNPVNWADPTGFGASRTLNAIQTTLSFVGFVPVVGVVADLANAGISVARGNYGEAALNAFSAIPGIGDAAAAGKLAITGVAISRAVRGAEFVATAAKVETAAVKQLTVIGHLKPPTGSGYVDVAESLGANYLKPSANWNWQKQGDFVKSVIERGDDVLIGTPIRQGDSVLRREINQFIKAGYEPAEQGSKLLIKKTP